MISIVLLESHGGGHVADVPHEDVVLPRFRPAILSKGVPAGGRIELLGPLLRNDHIVLSTWYLLPSCGREAIQGVLLV